ncbi:MAG TPA: ribonuclease III [Steroidobacteraceae bacterium]|nr:ribonuclease III [Steroidobacteraceae bacterium]
MTGGWPARWVRDRLGYEPRDPALFAAALTHRSACGPNNERLEFLGDAVLNLVVARHLYRAFPQATEGDLSRLRARVVSSEPLAEVAAQIGLGDALQLGSGELKTGGFRRQSILADALEAICGALFLDGGLPVAEQIIETLFEPRIAGLAGSESLKDAKTRLQEYLQSRGYALPRYSVERVEGEPHAQTFRVVCDVAELGKSARGSGSSRRRAEQAAAESILAEILSPSAPPDPDRNA